MNKIQLCLAGWLTVTRSKIGQMRQEEEAAAAATAEEREK